MAFPVHLIGSGDGRATGQIGVGEVVLSEPRVALTLYVAPFVPIITARTVANDASDAKLER